MLIFVPITKLAQTVPGLTLYPSCLHTTLASLVSHPSSQTVPQTPLMQISTLPALGRGPLTKRTVPLVQRWAAVFICARLYSKQN